MEFMDFAVITILSLIAFVSGSILVCLIWEMSIQWLKKRSERLYDDE